MTAAATLAVGLTLVMSGVARALPSQDPANTTYMVDGLVRGLAQVGNEIWIGGNFSHVLDPNGNAVQTVSSLAAFYSTNDALDGKPVSTVTPPLVTNGSAAPIIYDESVVGTTLYIAGKFTSVGGLTRKNIAAIDTTDGSVISTFHPNAEALNSVFATTTNIYAGGKALKNYLPDGSSAPGWTSPVAAVDTSLRGHNLRPAFRDITLVGGTVVVACACDSLKDASGVHPAKALAQIDGTTGAVLDWSSTGSAIPQGLSPDGGAFGEAVVADSTTIWLAAGGSDFTASYGFSPDSENGAQNWKTDTSGSSQTITFYQGQLVIGGHFQWVESPTESNCGNFLRPNTGCYHAPRLVSMDPASGAVNLVPGTTEPWNPGICCKYQGVWALLTDSSGTRLHVGGLFTRVGGAWTCTLLPSPCGSSGWKLAGAKKHYYYARLSDAP